MSGMNGMNGKQVSWDGLNGDFDRENEVGLGGVRSGGSGVGRGCSLSGFGSLLLLSEMILDE